jgi:sulfur carrier protein
MRLIIDGFEENHPDGLTVAELLDRLNEPPKDLVFELNHRYVGKNDYAATLLRDGDKIELIHAAFGG